MNEVNAPYMVGIFRAKTDNRAVFVIKAFAFLVAFGKLQAFFPPQPLYFLMIDVPAFNTQQFGYLAIAVAPVLLRQTN